LAVSDLIPRSFAGNLRFRRRLIEACRLSRRTRRAAIALFRRDLSAFIDLAVWQFNPDNVGDEVGPFISWEWQREVLNRTSQRLFRKGRRDALWEKSREMGATWLAVILGLHLCLFHRNKRVLCLSHKEEAIYKPGDSGTLFAKIQFILDHLPAWMTKGVERKKLVYIFPNGSVIAGAATTEAAGVGDRVSIVILDEFSKYRQKAAYEIWGATADTGPRLVIGTHFGVSGCYFDLTQRTDMHKEVLHWTIHPEKRRGLYESGVGPLGYRIIDKDYIFPIDYPFITDGRPHGGPHPHFRSPWYDEQSRRRANDRDVAQHLDIAPAQSQHNYFDALMIQSLQEASKEPVWEGDILYDPATGNPLGLRRVEGGPLKLWINPLGDNEVPAGKYGMGCDISQGVGSSLSVASIGDVRIGRKVAELSVSHLAPDEFALACIALGKLFRDYDGTPTMIAWETNGPGGAFGRTLKAKGYTRLFYRESKDMMRGNNVSNIPGWNASVSGAKRNLLDQYTIALRDRGLVNLSYQSFEDAKKYRYSDTKDTVEHPLHSAGPDPSGARSNHGDRVIADALLWMVMQRLGAGKVVEPDKPDPDVPPMVGTLEWRMSLHKRRDRADRDRRPTRVGRR
jgi:hypothetical protein